MFPPFLLWPRAPSWLPLAHCFPAWLWSIGLDNYLWGQWAVCTLSCSDANSTSNSPVPFLPPCVTQLSSYDPLMDRPVICCWKLLYYRGADRSAISVEESLPVRFAKSLTEILLTRVEIDIVSWSILLSPWEVPPSYSENLFTIPKIPTHGMGLIQFCWSWWQSRSSGREKWEYL